MHLENCDVKHMSDTIACLLIVFRAKTEISNGIQRRHRRRCRRSTQNIQDKTQQIVVQQNAFHYNKVQLNDVPYNL